MQRILRLALAQFNPTVGDIAGNTARIIEQIDEARAAHADLVAFPELAVTGYPPEDLLFKPSFLADADTAIQRIAAATRGIAALVGSPGVLAGQNGSLTKDVANAAAVINDGRVLDWYHKMYLPNYGVFDEDRYFRRGEECPVYVINGTPVGVGICEDVWYPIGPIAVQRDAGAEVIVNINASPFPRRQGRPAGADDFHPRRRPWRVRGLSQHRGRTGRTGIRRGQHHLLPGRSRYRSRAGL